jgi:V8-like Glu-specific endopeptidase
MKRIFRSMLVLLLALSMTTPGFAQVADPDNASARASKDVLTVESSLEEQEAALNFWTREKLAAAQPMDLPAQTGTAEVDAAVLTKPEAGGTSGFVAAGMAAADADIIAQAAYPEDWAALAETAEVSVDEPTGTSQIFTSYTINQLSALQRVYPHRWVGRLSFSTPSGTSFCSATAISGNNIVTAAHCVYDTTNNRFYSNWVFTPAYRAGNAPYGTFAWSACTVLAGWVNFSGSYQISWARYDVAVCTMRANSSGTTLNNAVGWAGRSWNFPYIQHYHNMGYPFRDHNLNLLPSAGAYLRVCTAESFTFATDVRGMGCNLGPGISGGPWMRGYAVNVVTGWVDGVNSGLFVGTPNIYGARFSSNNIVPLCNSRGC